MESDDTLRRRGDSTATRKRSGLKRQVLVTGLVFRDFFETHGRFSERRFLAAVKDPILLTMASLDPTVWSRMLLIPVAKRTRTKAKIAITGSSGAGESLTPEDTLSSPNRIYVGRLPENDIVVSCPSVSKIHAYFSRGEAGVWLITDAGSSNGTLLGEEQIAPHRTIPLSGSLVSLEFGPDARFIFMRPEALYNFVDQARRAQGKEPDPDPPEPPVLIGIAPPEPEPDPFASLRAFEEEEDAAAKVSRVITLARGEGAAPAQAPATDPPKPAAEPVTVPATTPVPVPAFYRSTRTTPLPVTSPEDLASTWHEEDELGSRDEPDDQAFNEALSALDRLGDLVGKVQIVLTLNDQVIDVYSKGGLLPREKVRSHIEKLAPLAKVIRAWLVVSPKQSIDLFVRR